MNKEDSLALAVTEIMECGDLENELDALRDEVEAAGEGAAFYIACLVVAQGMEYPLSQRHASYFSECMWEAAVTKNANRALGLTRGPGRPSGSGSYRVRDLKIALHIQRLKSEGVSVDGGRVSGGSAFEQTAELFRVEHNVVQTVWKNFRKFVQEVEYSEKA